MPTDLPDYSKIYQSDTNAPAPTESTALPDYSKMYQPSQAVSPSAPQTSGASGLPDYGSLYGMAPPTPVRDESDRFTQEDPNANWLEKAWTFANKPLTESLFGWGQYRSGAGGIERFAEKTLSGLTSPLSALMTAAFLPLGIGESVAGSALKEGLVEGGTLLGEEALSGPEAALKVEQYANAVKAADKARVAGQSIKGAVEAAGMPEQQFLTFGQYLKNQGMKETDILSEGLARRGISQGLSAAGVAPGKALAVAKGAETLVNAGFGIQAVHGAMYAYPRALDRLEEGDYDGAAEAILEAGTDTIFGALGLAHSIHSIQDIIPGINEKADLPLSDQTENLLRMFHEPEAMIADSQFKAEAVRREQHAQMLETAGLPEFAAKFRNIPEGEKFRWDKEAVQMFRDILLDPKKREALSRQQMKMYFALDTGKSAELASQQLAIMIHSFKLEEWAKLQNLPVDVRDQRTIGDIAREEGNNLLMSRDLLGQAQDRITRYNKEIEGLTQVLKDAKPEEQDAIRAEIAKNTDLLNAEHLALPELEDEYRRNKRWEAPVRRFETYDGWINKLKAEIEKNPDDAKLAVDNQKRIDALRARIAREYTPLYREKYEHLNRQLDEAAKDIVPNGPGDRNALDEFNKKLRIMGVNPQDIAILEEAFPQFRLPKSDEEFQYERRKAGDMSPAPPEYERRLSGVSLEDLTAQSQKLDKDLADAQAKLDAHSPKDVERNTDAYQWDLRTVNNIKDHQAAVQKAIGRLTPENREFPLPATEVEKQEGAARLQKVENDLLALEPKIQEITDRLRPDAPKRDKIDQVAILWAQKQRDRMGDRFATQQELESGKSDPMGAWGNDPGLVAAINDYLKTNGYDNWYQTRQGLRYNFDNDPEYQKLSEQYNKLTNERDRLTNLQSRGLGPNYVGEIHKLPDGARVLYLPESSLAKINSALGRDRIPLGIHIPSVAVDFILKQLKAKRYPNEALINLIEKARDKDLTVSLTPESHRGPLSRKLWTLREELAHRWQGSLSDTVAGYHLGATQYHALFKEIPDGVQKHMTSAGYSIDKANRVVEAAAKLMAVRDLSQLGTNPDEAAAFLHKYFTAVRARHGDNAFDNLTHITTFARQQKEKFINAYRTEPVPGPGQTEAPLAGVGAGGGGGPTKPPSGGGGGEPPEEYPFQHDPDWRKKFPPSTINGGNTTGFQIEPWQNTPLHRMLPDNISERIANSRAMNHTPEQIEYVKKIIDVLKDIANNNFTPSELELYKSLRKADDNNWEVGYNNGIIKSIVENHVHHIWGENPKKGYPSIERAGSGAFAINASQARHRSWGTALEGILQGRQLKVHDPASIIAHDANNIAVAAGHRKIMESLKTSGLKDPEGMPIGVFFGRGTEVPGEDGSPSSILVNPNVVRNIILDKQEIQRLTSAGLLGTYLKDGRVVDRTPQVNQNNVKDWITATTKKLNDLINKNPLLANPKDRIRHEAGWGQLKNFAQEQAGKISDYLNKAIEEIKNTSQGGKYGVADPANKPQDIEMAEYLDKVLHGKIRQSISAGDLKRLEEYQKRNENYSNGLTGKGNKPMTPADVAQLLAQEKKHLDPELTSYVDEHHDLFSRDKQGNVLRDNGEWTRKGLSTAIYHIAHAAENGEYPQFIQDLSDLQYVDKNLTSANPITQNEHKAEALQRLQDINDRQPKQYLWAPKTHIVPDHPAFNGWKWMATSPDGTPVLAESDFGISRHYYDYIVNRLGLERSALRENKGLGKVTGPLLSVGGKVKSTILSGSPFHVIQEVLRAVMLGINPLVRPNPIVDINTEFQTSRGPLKLIRLGIENSLNLFNNRHMAEDAAVGVASHGLEDSIAGKIPIVSHYIRYSDQIHDLLFNRLIPSYKTSGFKNMFEKYAQAHPDWSVDAVAYQAAQHVNNAFGGINWREFGRSATTQDWFHLLALAPDWLESEMRFAAGLFKGVGIGAYKDNDAGKNFTQHQVAYMATVLWASARLMNLLYSGNAHYETPFGLATKDKDGREIEFSVRTMPTDILHMASDPMGFLNGRMSPFLRTEEEVRTGRNQYGQKLTSGEKYVDMVSNLVPIWGQAGLKQVTHLATSADVPGYAQVLKGLGATSAVYRTPAEKTAANLASERSEEGSMSPSKIQHHRLLLQIEDELRAGRINNQDIQNMVDHGGLPESDGQAIIKNVQETMGEDPETARLFSRVSRLDFLGADAVYQDANPREKIVLHKLLIKKARAYIKASQKNETPIGRANDPMFKRARQYAPLSEPVSQ